MNYILRFCLFVASVSVLGSCAEDMEPKSYNEHEAEALHDWIVANRPEIIGNLQSEGGYYVEILEGDNGATMNKANTAVSEGDTWVTIDFQGRDLAGNVLVTRNDVMATQLASFTKRTRYVPMSEYIPKITNQPISNGSVLAMSRELTLDSKYAADNGLDDKIKLRYGSHVRLYMPSAIVGSGSNYLAAGGYQGQYPIDTHNPIVLDMVIRDTIKNALVRENSNTRAFATENGALRPPPVVEEDDESSRAEGDDQEVVGPDHADHPYNYAEDWCNAVDSIPELYVNLRFDPSKGPFAYDKIADVAQYSSSYAPYDKFGETQAAITEALKKRFDFEENPYEGVKALVADSVTVEGTAKIWFIGRFLDGFIFDTNIDEVRDIIYGESGSSSIAFDYSEGASVIDAWKYTIPNLKYGQWAAILTTSLYGYGSVGKDPTSASEVNDVGTEMPPNAPLIFEIYVEPEK